MTKPSLIVLLALLACAACGHSSSGAFDDLDGAATDAVASHDAPKGAAAPSGDDASSPAPEASTGVDAGEEAGAVESLCVGLGATCKDSTTCLCGVGSACTFDNVDCIAGVCAVSFDVPLDAGEECCAACQSTYDSCTNSSKECISQWTTCNDACAGACPVLCLAAQGAPGG